MTHGSLTHGSLFSGIGGFDLGFERAGFKTVWQVEIDPFCRRVLAKHFPEAERFKDVRSVGRAELRDVDVITGGFPCQDVSVANSDGEGLDGSRSGLWFEYQRIIGELRPRYVVVENVPNLFNRGIGRVLGGLASLGYDTEWQVISAADVGSIHLRERVWIVAYASGQQGDRILQCGLRRDDGTGSQACLVADDGSQRAQGLGAETLQGFPAFSWCKDVRRIEDLQGLTYLPEPLIRRNRNGFSSGVDRLKGLGNAVVPQITQWIAERIKQALLTGE